jgi:O-antigen ligase
VVRWGAYLAGLQGGVFGTSSNLRVFPAAVALIILQGAIIAVSAWRRSARFAVIALALSPAVILLQHRTVWVAAALVACLAAMRHPRFAGGIATGLVLVVGLSMTIFALAFEEVDAGGVGGDLSVAAVERGTWQWRVDGWRALLDEQGHTAIEEHLFGQPFGSGFEREVDGSQETSSPHNYYLEVYLRLGLVGVGLLFGLYLWVLGRLWRAPRGDGLLSPDVLLLLIATQLVYYIPYAVAEQAVLFGLAASAAAVQGVRGQVPHAGRTRLVPAVRHP